MKGVAALGCFMLLFLAGCAALAPTPPTTPFDANPELGSAYIKEYRKGYALV